MAQSASLAGYAADVAAQLEAKQRINDNWATSATRELSAAVVRRQTGSTS